MIKSLSLVFFAALTVNACGTSKPTSEVASLAQHECETAAYDQRDSELNEIKKASEADLAACYQLLEMGHNQALGLCIKAAESQRKEATADAERKLQLVLASCQPA
jgi:hypothetical protein